MRHLLGRLLREERGQDIIEYALLAAFIGVVGILTWQAIGGGISTALSGWDTGVQGLSSCTPDPGRAGC
jgi:Flp pilus assembly pilin Flp